MESPWLRATNVTTAPDALADGRAAGQPVVVGVTGHRPARLRDADAALLRARIREVLDRIATATGVSPVILSPLAEGADRLVAWTALRAGLPLHCVLPFPRDVYARDFPTASSREDFAALLDAAAIVVELDGSAATPEERDAGYRAVGDYTVARCTLLIAVWDGAAPRGEGGTGEVVALALARRIPVVWIAASTPHLAVLLVANDHDGRRGHGARQYALTALAGVLPPRP